MTRRTFLRAEWRRLLLLNYAVPPSLLEPLVPHGTELDPWQGSPYVSLVGFRFQRTRVFGIPIPLHGDFVEVNLRFYVRRTVGDEVRHGVVFVRELVASPLIVFAAKLTYNEPYRRAAMSGRTDSSAAFYGWNYKARAGSISALPDGAAVTATPGTENAFMTTRHWGYTRQRDGGTIEYRVEHRPWSVQRCTDARASGPLVDVFGGDFAAVLAAVPSSAMFADGSPVSVSVAQRIAD
jgi:uncharacterized protein YqjF (DUF2071 family)